MCVVLLALPSPSLPRPPRLSYEVLVDSGETIYCLPKQIWPERKQPRVSEKKAKAKGKGKKGRGKGGK